MDFPYQLRGDQRFPMIPLVLVAGQRQLRVDALVDSGASISVFQGSIAEYLGLPLTAGERRTFQGVGGKAVGYIHVVRLIVGGSALRCRVAFSHQMAVSINLIGRVDFFRRFLVTFDEARQRLRLIPRRRT